MNASHQQCDAGHLSFLELMRVISEIAGDPFVAGALVKTGLGIASRSGLMEFSDFESMPKSVDAGTNTVASFEGLARYDGNGLFGPPIAPSPIPSEPIEGSWANCSKNALL